MTRVFMNLPALPDRAAVVAECERIGAIRVGGYRGHDGLRVCVELPDCAIERLSDEARNLERRALALRETAEAIHGQETAERTATVTVCSHAGILAGGREPEGLPAVGELVDLVWQDGHTQRATVAKPFGVVEGTVPWFEDSAGHDRWEESEENPPFGKHG